MAWTRRRFQLGAPFVDHRPRMGSTTEVICKAMKGHARYRHLRVDWVGELAAESITLCGIENEDSGTEQTLCPGSGADRIVGAIRAGVRRGDADYAAMT